MSQTTEGAVKIAAKKSGLSVAEYERRVRAGLKRCVRHGAWHPLSEFGTDKSRGDGKASSCKDGRKSIHEETYEKKPRQLWKRPASIQERAGDKRQARSRVNRDVVAGRLARPDSLPCADCGHRDHPGCKNPHEYDHFKGYGKGRHLVVEAVCRSCHFIREGKRMRKDCPVRKP